MIKEATHKLFLLCAFLLAAAAAGAQTGANRIYVSWERAGNGDGSSWDNATTLETALQKATAGTEIWLKGSPSPYQPGQGNPVYVVPDQKGFTVPAGVALYGGFSGMETSPDEREVVDGGIAYRMKYRTVLTGDIRRDDQPHNVNLIFPENTTRSDNATHVLTLDLSTGSGSLNSGAATVVNGVTIARGHADGSDEVGGGIYVTAGSGQQVGYRIEQCFFIGNYATRGGGLYVADGVEDMTGSPCLVDRCGFFNNAAGSRSDLANQGGAIYLGGAGCVVNTAIFNNENGGILIGFAVTSARVLNSTVTRNTGSGIDGPARAEVVNTVVWGNAALYSAGTESPNFQYCAYPESDGTGSNIYLSDKNNDPQGPHFNSPSLRAGFDRDYDVTATLYPLWTWVPLEGSDLIDRGDNDAYPTTGYGSLDLAGNPRVAGPEAAGATIDIGAFEYQPVPSSRIRYVKPDGTGDGTSWANASGDLQRMIDQLAEQNPQDLPGEVWVAAGTYEPQAYLINGEQYSSSFRMRSGISVYGGFDADNPESSKAGRAKVDGGMPWQFTHRTILQGSYYSDENVSYGNNRWSVTGDSRHVVWFAPMPGVADGGFTRPTYLDGVTVKGGYAQGGTGLDNFKTDRGAGVYMDGADCYLTNSIVTQNNASGPGGGVYLRDGRIQGCLVYNNNAGQDGGAVYVEGTGLVHRSMLANNSAANGAGVYLSHTGSGHPEYLILSTCVVTNNTARENGAVYCAGGGVLLQNTVANNWCPTTTDATDPDASQTGGLYIDGYGLVFSTVLWNNRLGGGTQATAGTNIPVYVRNPSVEQVRFSHCAISGVNNAVWNDVLQEQMLSLVDANAGDRDNDGSIGPRFSHGSGQMVNDVALNTTIGVQSGWTDRTDGTANTVGISYYWEPVTGSNLWARGMELGQLPEEVVLAPELDLAGTLFNQRPAIGAHHVDGTLVVPELDGQTLRLYVDAASTLPENDGRSWAQPYRSLNDAIRFFAGLTGGEQITVVENGAENTSFEYSASAVTGFEILVLEGNLYPRYAYVDDDPKAATLDVLPMPDGQKLRIAGGYAYCHTDPQDAYRDPLAHRSQLNGNNGGSALADGIYHVVTVEAGANVELDGFHIINGYAAGTAALQYGAGVLVHDGATVTLTGCILENNSAVQGAAVYADAAASLTLNNCVVNNNTNTTATNPVIVGPTNTTLNHVTIVNNVGAAVEDEGMLYASSFSKGNTSKNSIDEELATTGAEGAANFANPTNGVGATLGFDTYLGGYSSFRPLTSSAGAASHIINRVASATPLPNDIMGNERDLGGVPDLGAYEADLPKAGKVIYVRSYNTVWDGSDADRGREESDGEPSMDLSTAGDGSSWANAINGNAICYERAIRNPNQAIGGTEAGFYVNGDGRLRQSSLDYTPYATVENPYGPEAGCYSGFWEAEDNAQNQGGGYNRYNKIANNRDERYISGLQYAVEKAAYLNAQLAEGEEPVEVWVGAGIYTDYKGFVIRDKVNVLGGFPKDGVPGENDRHPLISDYIPANDADAVLAKSNYETILQIRKESPFERWDGYTPTMADWFTRLSGTQRHYVLYQPDECLPTWGIENDERNSRTGANQYRYPYEGNAYIDNTGNYRDYDGASWDGFTVRHGYIKNYNSNRDGGAGVRVFRGVTLQNLVIVNNCNNNILYGNGNNNNNRNRGGGLYMDGNNSRISNSFILNNCVSSRSGQTVYSNKDNYGGGAYMIVGTGYNMVVANNYTTYGGGGIFLESAVFYNNTIAYNYAPRSSGNQGASGMFHYEADDPYLDSHLELYNCLFYGNSGSAEQIKSSAAENFTDAYNCYISGNIQDNLESKFSEANGNQYSENLGNPFEQGAASQSLNNYRLSLQSTCINRGTEAVRNEDGEMEALDLPETDMDFTDRIKDCTIDIGAYELDNAANTRPDRSSATLATYFVTYNGRGDASANSPANAACWEKLQTVLNAAGQYALENPEVDVRVKIAGYEEAEDFPYHVTALADERDPQSYSFLIPYGVTVLGGYNEGDSDGNDANWSTQDATTYKTILSAVKLATSTTQEINGYHTVTFGGKPEDWTGADKPTILDGVWLQDGSATSMAGAGNPATRGGGAIVPRGAHVRNCVVTGNSAIEGGGLYVLPGGRVSGTLVTGNSATTGGGIYVSNEDNTVTENNRAHLFSNTIAENSATTGGGLYLEDGAAMTVNSVIWGNLGDDGKNVSGVVNELFKDTLLGSLSSSIREWYPFNNCFVETRELPGNFENSEMTGERDVYFADLYMLKPYSPLVNHGMVESVQEALEVAATFGLAAYDMAGTQRTEGNFKMDAGAFARNGAMPTGRLVTRLFVSQGSNVVLADGEGENDYIGRSFYTSFTWLEDALDYIKEMRSDESAFKKDARAAEFEILVAGGTYKPRYRRGNTGGQEKNSFVIPYGVRIYGGFSGTEQISTAGTTEIPAVGGNISLTDGGDISDILAGRAYSDFNQNGIEEAWELAEQTIFSGVLNGTTADGKNANHVLYSVADGASTDGAAKGVVLDGVTVMGGATETSLSAVTDDAADLAEGRGGGIYSNGIPYTLVRSRLLDNQAVRGGGIFVKDADLTIVNSILAGNRTVENMNEATKQTLTSRGGAAYVADNTQATTLYAVNTLWANNESSGEGGAIGTNYNTGTAGSSAADPLIDLMNCTFVLNKAQTNPVIYNHNGKSTITNTLIWGNEGTHSPATSLEHLTIVHSASDEDYDDKFADGNRYYNILLSKVNMAVDGPRFTRPATVAGADGNSADNLWNPASTSLVTDAGDGRIPYDESGREEVVEGAYDTWEAWTENAFGYKELYMGSPAYERYSGPRGENNVQEDKAIDIGVYEYQYYPAFSTMTAIYVDTLELGNGTDWAHATSDLRGAIIGAANPTDGNGPRTVYVRDGEYSWSRLSTNSAYLLEMSGSELSESLTLKGSCTGVGLGDAAQQDFSRPSVIRNHPKANGMTGRLLNISANGKQVTVEGFTFLNEEGSGIDASTGSGGSLTLKNTAFRMNRETGVNISSNSGSVLIVNTLFADNKSEEGNAGTGLVSAGKTTLVNTTFANNGTDMTIDGSNTSVYNSVSWNNGNQGSSPMQQDESYNNKVFGTYYADVDAARANNENIEEGPNFVDPLNDTLALRNYRIRPSLTLLNKGDNRNYLNCYYKVANPDASAIPATECDLYNVRRVVDRTIDIGAYEYEAPLQQVIYVKEDLPQSNQSGSDWANAMEDLQGAADLAGIYANNNNGDTAYVFVHNKVKSDELFRVTLPNVKVYGGMDDETSTEESVEALVNDLRGKRAGLLERDEKSKLQSGVAVSAASVVDGFEVGGPVTLSGGGYLSTSVVNGDVSAPTGTQTSAGILYNTLVYGSVGDVQAVNVTATGTIFGATGSANNRASVQKDSLNRYVTEAHWNYQLNEYSPDMDVADEDGSRGTATQTCIDMVGHSRDIAGNLRIRNTVDNGCFETWKVVDDMTASADDYPHGKSVVYVRADKELILGKNAAGDAPYYGTDNRFNPGFLLLEHRAGLRGNGNYVGLTHFAVERDLGSDGTDLAAIPFEIADNDLLYNIVDATDVTVRTYNGEARAAYNYKFDSENGAAWETVTNAKLADRHGGFALETEDKTNRKVRFYGKSYSETPTAKVDLEQHNHRDPWSSPEEDGSNYFTPKENMGWNLFGSPYLCAMNYSDMEYGRVLYGLEGDGATASYTTVLTYNNSDGSSVDGHIPAGDAVFTQTATLGEEETFSVEQPKVEETITKKGTAYANEVELSLYLASASGEVTTRSAATAAESDRVLLNAVPAEQSISDFDLGIDGVKWMAADGKPQIFAVRGAGRYSLLGALDVESTATVGVTTAGAEFYEIGIPDDCPAEGYETVRLRDRKTGAEADLLQEPYVFSAVAGEDCTERFEVSFRAAADELLPGAGMTASVDETGLLRVGNLPEGTTRVTLYDAEGRAVAAAGCAGRTEADFRLTAHGVYVVQADGGARVKIVW